MSRRFGRNQRRRAREAIAALTAQNQTSSQHLWAAQNDAGALRAEIALFKELMSPFWIGFDPLYQAVGHNDKNQPTLHVFDPPPMPLAPPGKDAMTATAMLKAMPLDVMASRCDLDAMRGDIHVFVRYADGTHQYAVRQEALRRYPRHVITERVAQYLAEYIMSDVPQRGRYG